MSIENEQDLIGLSRAGRVVALTLREVERAVKPGVTTAELDRVAARVFARFGAVSAPQKVYGAPSVIFISVNDEAVHGVPGRRKIRAGDLVKIDVTAELHGYVADAAVTVAVPPVSPLKRRLCACTQAALDRALAAARAGRPVYEIGRAVEGEVGRRGFAVLRELRAHGVGHTIHEAPTIPNYYDRRYNTPLTEGLVITLEPIVSTGSPWSVDGGDGWTISTADGSLAAHYEHTIIVTRGRPVILTAA